MCSAGAVFFVSRDRGAPRSFRGMKTPPLRSRVLCALVLVSLALVTRLAAAEMNGRYLYVAAPGIRDYLEYGGHGVLVFDIDHRHKFVKRIPFQGLDPQGKPDNVK